MKIDVVKALTDLGPNSRSGGRERRLCACLVHASVTLRRQHVVRGVASLRKCNCLLDLRVLKVTCLTLAHLKEFTDPCWHALWGVALNGQSSGVLLVIELPVMERLLLS